MAYSPLHPPHILLILNAIYMRIITYYKLGHIIMIMVIIIVTWANIVFVLIVTIILRFLLLTDYNLQSVVIQSYVNNIVGEITK